MVVEQFNFLILLTTKLFIFCVFALYYLITTAHYTVFQLGGLVSRLLIYETYCSWKCYLNKSDEPPEAVLCIPRGAVTQSCMMKAPYVSN